MDLDELTRLFTASFLHEPGAAFLYGVENIIGARSESERLITHSDAILGDDVATLAMNLEKIACGCIRSLSKHDDCVDALFNDVNGKRGFELAVFHQLRVRADILEPAHACLRRAPFVT